MITSSDLVGSVKKPAPVHRVRQKASTPVHDLRSGADESPPVGDFSSLLLGKPKAKKVPDAKQRRPIPQKRVKQLRRKQYERPSGDGFNGGVTGSGRSLVTIDDLTSFTTRARVDVVAEAAEVLPITVDNRAIKEIPKVEVEPLWDKTSAKRVPKKVEPSTVGPVSTAKPLRLPPQTFGGRNPAVLKRKNKSSSSEFVPTISEVARNLATNVVFDRPPPARGV